ncbi:hypothetical protein GF389_01740 [Candidatus Dojkabacteria bacterium]|nr:hypothetical protein [Candidatus Dojkabacteria bacterium]
MEALIQKFSLTLPLWVFLIAGLYLVIATFGLWRLVAQSLELSTPNTPKQGFLNKPLIQFIAVFAISVSMIGLLYIDSTSKDIDLITEAEKEIEIEIDHEITNAGQIQSDVSFSATPTVEGKEWGDPTEQFDIVWTIQEVGGTARNFVEQGRSAANPSKIKVTLDNGTYRITTLISDEDQTYSETIEVEL